jgi:hypothetical protein
MDLLAPSALWLLALAAPLVVLYVLRVKRERRRVPSVWLWQAAARDLMARAPFRKLLPEVPLVLELLALACLALAAARPARRARNLAGDHFAIVVDTSASMAAVDPSGKARIDLAKDAARALVAGLPPGADAMLVEAARDARVVAPAERDTRRLARAIDGLAARDVEGDLGAAVTLAAGRLEQLGGRRTVVVITDGYLARPADVPRSAVGIDVVEVGDAVDNAAIVRVDVRLGTDPVNKRPEVQAFLLLANSGQASRELYVTMRQRNASDVLSSRRVRVAAGAREPVVLTFHPSEGDYGTGLVFDIAPHDALAADDVAFGRVPPGRALPVVLASASGEPSPWLGRALESDPDADVATGSLETALAGERVPHDAFVVLDGACPEAPPGGDLLVVRPPAGVCLGVRVGEPVERPLVTSWRDGDERLRFVTLDEVRIATARLLEPESTRQGLVRASEGWLVADASGSARVATVVGFDVGESNWPLKASFVLFVRNLLEQARRHRAIGAGPARTGEPLRIAVPRAATAITVAGPDGEPRRLAAQAGLAVLGETGRSGFYVASWRAEDLAGARGPGGALVVPVNLASPEESDLSRKRSVTVAGAGTAGGDAAAARLPEHRDYGWLFALAALALVVADAWYLTRKPRAVRLAGRTPRLPDRVTRSAPEAG